MPEARQIRVLIIDDNQDAADLLAEFFLLHGYMTQIEYDGFAGLSAVLAFAPNVVILDLGMPSLDGFETARQIRALKSIRQPRLVAFSAWGDNNTRAKAKEVGFDAHVVKPSDLNILLAEIDRS
jgi:DNA-binding response OmpR family regulator